MRLSLTLSVFAEPKNAQNKSESVIRYDRNKVTGSFIFTASILCITLDISFRKIEEKKCKITKNGTRK